ncbi:MAG TPA: SMC-Scp complex subunit ScpB [Candidatus Acidoferrum sp.]|nr:SMC-Scp complex subunit ScpB [Candidatus Acidoferrum sp.]
MELKLILEAILFSAQKPLTPKELRDLLAAAAEHGDEAKPFKKTKEDAVAAALEQLRSEHEAAGRSFRLACVAGAWQFVTQPEYAPWVIALVGLKARPPRLSQPALETLAIIAYRQPVTRAEIEQVRGVTIDGVMATLLERGLIQQAGRAEVVGHPMTYGTTALFLEYFGLRDLEGLPAADELRRIPVARPEGLLTADPGPATAPPDQLTLAEVQQEKPAAPAPPGNEPQPPAEEAQQAADETQQPDSGAGD